MPRPSGGPLWLARERLSPAAALAIAECLHDRIRLRRVLQQAATDAPPGVTVPDPKRAETDVATAVGRMEERGGDQRRARLLRLTVLEGLARGPAAGRLFLSERQFYRVRQEAFEELAEELSILWSQPALGPGPLSFGQRLPLAASFVGRRQELEESIDVLRNEAILLVAGPPGIGKTALAAKVVEIESGRLRTAWHRFRPGLSDSPAAVLLTLGRALSDHGDERLQRLLESDSGQPLWLAGAIDLARQALADTQWLLWFDDTDVVADNREVCALLQMLHEECPAVRLLLSGRTGLWRLPDLPQLVVPGLGAAEAAELLAALQVPEQSAENLAAVVDATGGAPQLLRLTARYLTRSARPEHDLETLSEQTDVHSFLLRHVFDGLREDEREILKGASLLRTGVTAAFLARAFGDLSDSVPDALVRLGDQFLLAGGDGGLRLHSSLRHFCRSQLAPEPASRLHRALAGTFADAGDRVESCHHWIEAGMLAEASAALVAGDWRPLPADRREVVAELCERLLSLGCRDQEVFGTLTAVLRSLGRSEMARGLLRSHASELRDPGLMLVLGRLEREAGNLEDARAALSKIVSGGVSRGEPWRIWWELALVERAQARPEAAIRMADRALDTVPAAEADLVELGKRALAALPSACRLAPAAAPGIDAELIEVAFSEAAATTAPDLLGLVATAAVSHALPGAPFLLRRLGSIMGRPVELQVDTWLAEAIHAAAIGDYRAAWQRAKRASESAAGLGKGADGAILAATAALYRVMAGDQRGALGQLAAAWPPGTVETPAARRVRAFAEAAAAARWPAEVVPSISEDLGSAPALESARALAGGADPASALEADAGICADHRMILLDLAIAIDPRDDWQAERRRRRLAGHPTGQAAASASPAGS